MSLVTQYKHIVLDENGVPIIEGTSMKVIELVVERLAYGWSPEELHFQHPYLTLGSGVDQHVMDTDGTEM